MRNLEMVIQYDGGRYEGWQRLGGGKAGRTIQGVLEEALSGITGAPVEVIGSGRTDAGVHALGQVANFHTRSGLSCGEIVSALERTLPPDLAVRTVKEADPRFHARFHARAKRYAYRLDTGAVHDVFMRRYALHIPRPLDWDEMRRAADCLCGRHDFTSCTNARLKEKSAERVIHSIEFVRDGQFVDLEFFGDGFLHNMVRILAGTLVEVSSGRLAASDIPGILEARSRQAAGPMLPAHALVLVEVLYGQES
ncbi:MAG TPA: tRNA pseudouridine(38-40) synthase TruA [Spirochaetota bacterium]|nr:tRNA pseudouridine(38-40) synthase TruA [Spirochaetota bacterium]HPH03083.1 tRNA pseudouridine(38-40) synthase TruA [Spirochaetota bacterium]